MLNNLFSDPLITKFITLCELINNPVPKTEDTVAIYAPQRSLYDRLQRIFFIPDHFQASNDLEFGRMPTKTFLSKSTNSPVPLVNQKTGSSENCGESTLLPLAIVICLVGLLIVLIYFIRYS